MSSFRFPQVPGRRYRVLTPERYEVCVLHRTTISDVYHTQNGMLEENIRQLYRCGPSSTYAQAELQLVVMHQKLEKSAYARVLACKIAIPRTAASRDVARLWL